MRGYQSARVAMLLLVVTVVLAACSNSGSGASGDGLSSTGEKEQVRIALFTLLNANPYFAGTAKGVEAAATADGAATVEVFDGNLDPAQQQAQIQDAVTSGRFDALIVQPIDGPTVATGVEDAIAEGLTVVGVTFAVGDDPRPLEPQVEGMAASVQIDQPAFGRELGELTVDACKDRDPCEVAILIGGSDLSGDLAQEEGIREVLDANASIEIVDRQEGAYAPDPSYQVTQNLLQAHPSLDVVVTIADEMAIGVEQAIEEAGRAGEVAVIGSGTSGYGVQAVQDGRWFATVVSRPETEGRVAAELAIAAVRGEEIEVTGVNPHWLDDAWGAAVTALSAEGFPFEYDL